MTFATPLRIGTTVNDSLTRNNPIRTEMLLGLLLASPSKYAHHDQSRNRRIARWLV